MEMYDAYDADHQEVYAFKASGNVSGAFINIYPPVSYTHLGQPHCGQKYPEELRHQCTKSAHLAARPPAFFVQHEEAPVSYTHLDVYKRQL